MASNVQLCYVNSCNCLSNAVLHLSVCCSAQVLSQVGQGSCMLLSRLAKHADAVLTNFMFQVKMVTGDQQAIAIETCRRLGLGTNIMDGRWGWLQRYSWQKSHCSALTAGDNE